MFGGVYRLHLQGTKVSPAIKQQKPEASFPHISTSFLLDDAFVRSPSSLPIARLCNLEDRTVSIVVTTSNPTQRTKVRGTRLNFVYFKLNPNFHTCSGKNDEYSSYEHEVKIFKSFASF
jgi:hypothetical protein